MLKFVYEVLLRSFVPSRVHVYYPRIFYITARFQVAFHVIR